MGRGAAALPGEADGGGDGDRREQGGQRTRQPDSLDQAEQRVPGYHDADTGNEGESQGGRQQRRRAHCDAADVGATTGAARDRGGDRGNQAYR